MRADFGPTNDNGEWRIKYNNELYTLCKGSDTVTYIEISRLNWAAHVIGVEEQSATGRVLVAVVEGRRQRVRPKLRWEGCDGRCQGVGGEKLEECCKE